MTTHDETRACDHCRTTAAPVYATAWQVLGSMVTVHLCVSCTREDDRPIRPDGLWRTAVRRRVVPLGETVTALEQDRIDALAREVQRHGMFGCRRVPC